MSVSVPVRSHVAMVSCLALVGSVALTPAPGTMVASATWYWQNPLPRDYAISSVACPSVTTCVATGGTGSIVTTSDGGLHWTDRTSGIDAGFNMYLPPGDTSVACPGPAVCYAVGSKVTGYARDGSVTAVHNAIIKSTDGGKTWRQPSPSLPAAPAQFVSSLACPSVSTCLAGGWDYNGTGTVRLLRTTDGGQTWHAANVPGLQFTVAVTCASRSICFAVGVITKRFGGLLRSTDGGKTWTARGIHSLVDLTTMTCPAAGTCFAITQNCGGECDVGSIYVTRNGAGSWKQVAHRPTGRALGSLACPTVTTCYLLSYTPNPQQGNPNPYPGPILVTRDAGVTWQKSVVSNDEYLSAITCATAQACRVTSFDGIFGTTDGGKTWERERLTGGEPAPGVTSLACPAVDTCYAVGGVDILATHPPT